MRQAGQALARYSCLGKNGPYVLPWASLMSCSPKAKNLALSWIAPCARSIPDAICQSALACPWPLIWRCPRSQTGAFIGASIDFKAAHKQVQVRPEEHGLLLFAFQRKLYHYRVCHFGGRFSAFWWQRTGAFLLRQVHGLLAWKPPQSLSLCGRPALCTRPG